MAEYSRPFIPYPPEEPLQNDDRYAIVAANNQPITPDQLDGDFNYVIDSLNSLYLQIQAVQAGTLTGSDQAENANKFITTDGQDEPTLSWTLVRNIHIADNEISGGKIQNSQIINRHLGPACVTSDKIYGGAITAQKMAPNSVPMAAIQVGAVDANRIAELSIIGGEDGNIAEGTITAFNIAENTITGDEVADNSVPATKLMNNSITAQQLAPVVQIPIGGMIPWPSALTVAPAGFVFARGQLLNRVTYASLFAVYGTTYGAGDGATTFGVPDSRGRVLVGVDMATANTPAATGGRVTTATVNQLTVGGVGGFEQHTLTVDQIPSHNHPLTFYPVVRGVGQGAQIWSTDNGPSNTENTGGDQPHNNLQPSLLTQMIIYAGV